MGWILIILGILYLINTFFYEFSIWHFIGSLWPVLLILLGIYIIANRGRISGGTGADTTSKFLGELHIDFRGQEIGEKEISIFMGEVEVDLADCNLVSGENEIKVSMGIGESIVRVPGDIPLRISARLGVGRLNIDNRDSSGIFPTLEHIDEKYQSADSRLHLQLEGFAGEMSVHRE